MLKKLLAVAMVLFIASSCLAAEIDSAKFNKALKEYADAISQVNYNVKGIDCHNEPEALDIALTNAERTEKTLENIISSLTEEKDISTAYNLTVAFSKKSELNEYAAQRVFKMLHSKTNYLSTDNNQISSSLDEKITKRTAQAPAANSQNLMKKRHKRLIMIDTPMAEAIVCFEDTGTNRRVINLNKIFKRHGCKIISSYVNENKKGDRCCYYFTGKKYVIDALLGHFDGSVVNSDLKAAVKVTTGGFWGGKKNYTFYLGPKRSNKDVMGELAWYKTRIEHNPIAFFAENNYDELATIGSKETVAGINKLLFKNVKVEVWVFAGDMTEADSIYHNKLELGDIYIDAK